MYDVFTTQLGIPINQSAADCLKLNFEGNAHLDKNEVDQAITCYDKVSTTLHVEAPPFPVSYHDDHQLAESYAPGFLILLCARVVRRSR